MAVHVVAVVELSVGESGTKIDAQGLAIGKFFPGIGLNFGRTSSRERRIQKRREVLDRLVELRDDRISGWCGRRGRGLRCGRPVGNGFRITDTRRSIRLEVLLK